MNVTTIPKSIAGDTDDTRWALETAATLWEQGERREALRWVRRAAEAAAESGADDRALALAKSGAELRAAVDLPRTLPPPPPEPVVTEKPADQPAPRPAEASAELVVTVVSTDGSIPARDASFVSHRAVRVAISPMAGDGEQFVVRALKPGEVASKDSTVGLLVSFEPGVSPLPKQ